MPRLDYRVLIEPLVPEDGGGFVATAPDLPGCMSDGETPEDALPTCKMPSRPGSRKRVRLAGPCPSLHNDTLRPNSWIMLY
jgi:hypothetical protein